MTTRIERLILQIRLSFSRIRQRIKPDVLRLIWRVLSAMSLFVIALASYYAWRSLPRADLVVRPQYLVLAGGIYAVSYSTHLLGWHALTGRFFGRLPFRENVYAVASSSFVKYLPTVAWYIANRAHFYTQRHIPVKRVVAASFSELLIMATTGGTLYVFVWLIQHHNIYILSTVAGISVVSGTLIRYGRKERRWQRFIPRQLSDLVVEGRDARRLLLVAMLWYGLSWPLGVASLWAILHTFVPLSNGSLLVVFNAWMLTGIASYILNLSLGTAGIARDITLAVMLAQVWPLPIAITAAIIVKLLLMIGEICCSGAILSWFWMKHRRNARV